MHNLIICHSNMLTSKLSSILRTRNQHNNLPIWQCKISSRITPFFRLYSFFRITNYVSSILYIHIWRAIHITENLILHQNFNNSRHLSLFKFYNTRKIQFQIYDLILFTECVDIRWRCTLWTVHVWVQSATYKHKLAFFYAGGLFPSNKWIYFSVMLYIRYS